ncbi:MAG: hypothetical protein R2712_10265 [Vicinamibacterales bacterium]
MERHIPSERTTSNGGSPDAATERTDKPIDIDDAAIDESASVDPNRSLTDNANDEPAAPEKGAWRERDANRRAHGPDDLKA